jgi:branched-subunit amino acid ABC-type transport system permease component
MSDLLQTVTPYCINGIALGLNVSLVALALALIWRTAGMIDFGLGAVYLVSAYSLLLLRNDVGLPLPIAIVLAVAMGGLTSLTLYFCLYRYFLRREAPLFILVLVALSIFIATENLLGAMFTAQKFYFIQTILPGWEMLGTRLNIAQISKMVVALLTLGAVALFCTRTRAGSSILAIADNRQVAQGVGINPDHAYMWTFGIAGLIVGAAAVPDVAESGVDPFIGFNPVFLALAAIIIGGLSSFRNPVLGAVMLGLAFHLAVWAFSSSWQEVVAYGLVILVLVIRPQGLFGGMQVFRGRT